MTAFRYVSLCVLVETLLLLAATVPGCASMLPASAGDLAAQAAAAQSASEVLATELEGLRADLQNLKAENPDAAEAADDLTALIDSKAEELRHLQGVFADATGKLQGAQDGWDLLETAVGVAAGFFPPLAVGVPVIRRSRRAFEGVVASIAAGGGPVNPQATRDAMAHYPGLKDYVTRTRVHLGDKRMEAVRVSEESGQ